MTTVINARLSFSDHDLIKTKCLKRVNELKRDWRWFYSKLLLCNKLANVQFDLTIDNVQGCWNDFENKLITVVDEILPVLNHCNDVIIAPIACL